MVLDDSGKAIQKDGTVHAEAGRPPMTNPDRDR